MKKFKERECLLNLKSFIESYDTIQSDDKEFEFVNNFLNNINHQTPMQDFYLKILNKAVLNVSLKLIEDNNIIQYFVRAKNDTIIINDYSKIKNFGLLQNLCVTPLYSGSRPTAEYLGFAYFIMLRLHMHKLNNVKEDVVAKSKVSKDFYNALRIPNFKDEYLSIARLIIVSTPKNLIDTLKMCTLNSKGAFSLENFIDKLVFEISEVVYEEYFE